MDQSPRTPLSRHEWPIMLLLFLAMLWLFSHNWQVAYGSQFGSVFGDVTATAAERVQAGEIPYRDFWTMYAPGSFYLLALLFTLFGNKIIVGTIAASVLTAAAACILYHLTFTLTGRRWAGLACALAFFGAAYSTSYYLSLGPYPPTIALVLLALHAIVYYYRSGTRAWLLAAGLATGTAIVFKHDVGGYTAISIALGLLLAHTPAVRASLGLRGSPLLPLALFSAAAALVALPVAVYFAVLAGHDMWRDLIVFPATEFKYTRGEHYPELIPVNFMDEWWLKSAFNFLYHMRFTLPFLMFALAIPLLLADALQRKFAYLPLGVTFVSAYLFHYASAHVQINTNVITLALYGTLLGVIAYDVMASRMKRAPGIWMHTVASAVVLFLFTACMAQPLYKRFREGPEYVVTDLPKIAGLRVSPEMEATLTKLVTFIDSHVPAGERIFLGLHRHDVTVIGDGKMYFILDRMNATRHDQLHPGIVNTARVQRDMIRDLQAQDVGYIIIRHVFGDEALDRFGEYLKDKLPQTGATDLDEYIKNNYRMLETTGEYEIWERRMQKAG